MVGLLTCFVFSAFPSMLDSGKGYEKDDEK
jgi:hypothetical protein